MTSTICDARASIRTALICGAVLLVGCKVGPDYVEPQPAVPAEFTLPADDAATSQPAADAAWWRSFNDEKLASLVDQVLAANLDLREARARVREARAARTASGADLFPAFDLNSSYDRSRRSGNSSPEANTDRGAAARAAEFLTRAGSSAAAPTSAADAVRRVLSQAGQRLGERAARVAPTLEQDLFQVGVDMNWEIDVFGGSRRAVEAAEADIEAADAGYRDVMVSLLAETALNYVTLRGAQRRLDIAAQNIKAQADSVDLARTRFDAGLTGELDVAQAEAQLATTQAQVPSLEIEAAQAVYRLSFLAAREPLALADELLTAGPIPPPPPQIPVGLPSDLLRRRPDIRQAERNAAAATARIGEATADLFPRFSITGAFGMQSVDFTDLFDWRSRAFSIGPAMRWPIFEGARIRSNIRVQNARQDAALARFERTVLLALREVQEALIAYDKERVRYEMLSRAVEANRRAVSLSTELYSKGLSSFLNVLDAERALYAAEDQMIVSQAAASGNLVVLYKALGGGWEVGPPAEAEAERTDLLTDVLQSATQPAIR